MNKKIPYTSDAKRTRQYLVEKVDFDFRKFARRHINFDLLHFRFKPVAREREDVSKYVSNLWYLLERKTTKNDGTLIALPNSYIVPGGRFNEQFYWDSYFIMLGLASEGRCEMIEGMINNFTYLIQKFGHIPNANRTYYLSRSQPPFLSHMIMLLSVHNGDSAITDNLQYLLKEYQFWMKNRSKLPRQKYKSFARVVEMDNGVCLNRYHDDKRVPRDEEPHKDVKVATQANKSCDKERLYLHLRSAAESGWDFSSRWFKDPNDISTIHTADLIPVDLNCLMYHLETTISEAYKLNNQTKLAKKFRNIADDRASAISEYCWDEHAGMFMDYDFHENQTTGQMTLAGIFPLYAKIASVKQAARVADVIERNFLKKGGLVTTLVESSQQWDYPNGWAPLQYIAIQGLLNYGYTSLAEEIKKRWVKTIMRLYDSSGQLFEKYNMVNCDNLAGGGEYPLQVGFGWTNGVLEALLSEEDA